MKCQNCYCEVKETDIYCKNCGKELKNTQKSVVNFNNPNYKRRNSHPWLIVGIILLIIVFAFIGLIIYIIKYDEEHPESTFKKEQTQIDKREKIEENQVDFNGYSFSIPSELTTNTTDEKLFIYGKNNEWVGVVMMKETKYDTLVAVKDQIQTLLSNQADSEKYDMSEAVTEEKEYGGKNFLITKNIKTTSYYIDITYGKADENSIYIVSVTKSDGTKLSETERNTIYSIIATSKKGV